MKCGYHKVKITPPLGAPLLGQYQERLAKGVLDDLYVKAIAFDSQGKQAVAIEVDVCLLTEATCTQFRKTIADYCKVSEDAILLICNHTHTGPMTVPDFASDKKPDPEYMAFLENALRDAAYYALQDAKPARFFVAESQAKGISFIRRWRMKDGSAKTNPAPLDPNIDHPIGAPNETVKLLKIVREGSDDIFIINFGTHSDTTAGEKLYISADFSYYACEAIEAAIPGTQCAFFLAPQGDVNHRNPAREDVGRVVSERENEDYKELCAHTRYMGRVIAGSVIAASTDYDEEPSYEVRSSSYGPGTDDALVAGMTALLNTLK